MQNSKTNSFISVYEEEKLLLKEEQNIELKNTKNNNSFELQQCGYCDRRFNPSSYEKHIKIC